MMFLHFTPLFVALSILSTALGRFDWTTSNGKTRLRGNSFGIGHQNATFDYIIVGGGTAGLTVASRLAAANASVAVIEAGGFYEFDYGNNSQVPGYGSTYLSFAQLEKDYQLVDWDLNTANQTGLNNRQVHYSAGKTLGGSSALNDMIFHRGTKGSMDWWADVVGDNSYRWTNFLPWLKKSTAFSPPNRAKISPDVSIPYDSAAWSSTGGPLQISYPNYRQPFNPYLEKAFAKAGLKQINGLNSGILDGYSAGTYVIDPRSETRSSSEESFLQEALDTTAIKVYTNTLAHKVLFDSKKAATGVLVETDGGTYTLSVKKEVVVSAGVFHSPQVLMLSGIGPAAQLQAHGIPVLSDLHGVGNNMLDQVFVFTNHEMNLTTNSGVLTNPNLHAAAVDIYLNEQNGPLTGVGGDIIGWEKISNRSAFTPAALAELDSLPSDWAEVEYVGLAHGANPASLPMANNYMFLTAAIFAPFSRGYVNITSASALDPPIINPNSLISDTEAQLAVQALKRLREFGELSGVQVAETNPGPDVQTDAQILEWIRNNSVNGYHAACSCRMGKASDPDAVLDSRAQVYGVTGLRVVDASAFAVLPPGHPMSTIYALAEKIADDMLSS